MERLKIKTMVVKNLFGRFNYQINFREDLTILTGPPGFGLHELGVYIDGRYSDMTSIEDENITVEYNKPQQLSHPEVMDKMHKSYIHGYHAEDILGVTLEDVINKHLHFKKLVKTSEYYGVEIDGKLYSNQLNQLDVSEKALFDAFYSFFMSKYFDIVVLRYPENYMHIAHQNILIDELMKILDGRQLIIITNSPDIIGYHWYRQVDLGEQYQADINDKN